MTIASAIGLAILTAMLLLLSGYCVLVGLGCILGLSISRHYKNRKNQQQQSAQTLLLSSDKDVAVYQMYSCIENIHTLLDSKTISNDKELLIEFRDQIYKTHLRVLKKIENIGQNNDFPGGC